MKELSKQDIEVVLAGKGLPGELLVGESLAKYFARLYLATKDSRDEQLSQRDAQIAALTAENVALKVQTPDARSAEMFEAIEKAEEFFEVGCPELALIEAFEILKLKSTPATDAAANALRAEGVEMAISQSFMDGIPVNRMQFIARMTAFANQLREGK
ncbi:hypothetical protein IDH70_04775 [Mixta calida]|nr:hypothetical protein IDH70_04775 [Mixta calida]